MVYLRSRLPYFAGLFFFFSLLAACGGGGGSGDAASQTQAPGTVPAVPFGLTAEAVASGTVHLTWEPGSSEITDYGILRNTEPSGTFSEVAHLSAQWIRNYGTWHYDSSSVEPETTYYYRVRAYKEFGTADYVYSAPTDLVSVTTPPAPTSAPGAPSGISVTPISDQWRTVAWTDNSSGSDGESYFQVESKFYYDSVGSWSSWSPSQFLYPNVRTYVAGGKGPQRWAFRVKAANAVGSAYSDSVTWVPNAAWVATAPSGLAAAAVSSSSIQLSWTDNTSDEDGFKVERSEDGVSFTQVGQTAANSTGHTDSGLTHQTSYIYKIRAFKGTDHSAYSGTSSAVTQQAVQFAPAAPGGLGATTVSRTQVLLNWTDNSDNETGFALFRSTTMGSGYVLFKITDPNVTRWTDTGLEPGTTYYYQATARNAAGESLVAGGASATTAPSDVPSAPTNLAANPASPTSMALNWSDNSSNEMGFKIWRSTSADTGYTQAATTAAGVTGATDTGLSPMTRYYYRVTAYNGEGESGYVQATNVTSAALAVPAAPSGLEAQTLSASAIRLTWSDNATDETGYRVERSTSASSGFSQVASPPAGTVTWDDTGLAAGSTRYYRVYAVNGTGSSDFSNVASAATYAVSSGMIRIFNNTRYALLDVRFNNAQQLGSGQYVPAHGTADFDASPGSVNLNLGVGLFTPDGAPNVWWSYPGAGNVPTSGTLSVQVDNPTIGQLMTQFAGQRDWTGEYWDQNGNIQWLKYTITSGSGWTKKYLASANNWQTLGSGSITVVQWDDYADQVFFKFCPNCEVHTLTYPFGHFKEATPSGSTTTEMYYFGQ